jgi:hypothetical protein
MLIETQASKRVGEMPVVALEGSASRQSFIWRNIRASLPFFTVLLQFGLIVLLVNQWQLESLSLGRVMELAFAGFIIHHLLPQRFRLPFFAILSVLATIIVVGEMGPKTWIAGLTGKTSISGFLYHLVPGLTLLGVGLGLIGLCHLPIRLWMRVGLVVMAGAALAFLRAHSQWFPDVSEMWVILGSMFMFRVIIYLYDLKHRTAPFSPARAISYFFMLPNVCFPLFPVVDYKTFCSTYYNEDWTCAYQTGLRWMLRGVFQLLLYRVVYQFAPLDVSNLSSSLDAVGFMVGTYLLYLRVSGTFHLIVGLLHMFGFNLPETHHLYLLAGSFTDLWRRINIYWKDFVMKLFFYPAHFGLRKVGTLRAMSVATLVTFFATWALHSWQWFWIRGKPLFSWQDITFWAILALLVLVNAVYEATWGQRRKLTKSRVTLRDRLLRGLGTMGTFSAICILWTVWSSHSWGELQALVDAASRPKLGEIAIVLGGLVAIGASSMLWGLSSRETSEGRATKEVRGPFYFWRSATAVSLGAICLLVGPSLIDRVVPTAHNTIVRLHHDALNARDLAMQRRGYYEELDVGRQNTTRWGKPLEPEGWGEGKKVFYRQRSDFLLKEIVSSVSSVIAGAPATSNSMGMRDREYDKVKPAGTYRIVLLGASHDMGSGVKDDQTYENLVEDHLNRERPDARYSRYEILNLSVPGDCILQMLLRLEQTGFELQPDAVIFSVAGVDQQFIVEHLRKCLVLGIEWPAGYREFLDGIVHKAGVDGRMHDAVIERRLLPYVSEVHEWVFRRLTQQCAQRGIHPLVIYRPAPIDFEGVESTRRSEIVRLARAAGLEVVNLSPAFDSVADRNRLIVAKWDDHTTALGHRLLADKLYEGLVPLLFGSMGQNHLPQP